MLNVGCVCLGIDADNILMATPFFSRVDTLYLIAELTCKTTYSRMEIIANLTYISGTSMKTYLIALAKLHLSSR